MLNSLKTRHKLLLGFSVPMLLIVIVAFIVYNNVTELVKTANLVEHTQGVISSARELGNLILDMETGQRGFLITGRNEFLDPFKKSQNNWDHRIRELKKLVSDNSEQVSRIEEIDGLAKQWLTAAAQPEIAARIKTAKSRTETDAVIALVAAGTGKKIIDAIRVKLDKFNKVETELIETRALAFEKAVSYTISATIHGTALAIFLSLFSALLVSAAITGGLRMLVEKAREIAGGNFTHKISFKSNDELGVLDKAFNQMGEDLQSSMGRLHAENAERKQAEKNLKETLSFLENIFDNSLDAIVAADSQGNIVRTNKAFQKMIGYSEEQLVGKSTTETSPCEAGTYASTTGEMIRIGDEFFRSTKNMIAELFEKQKVANREVYLLTKNRKLIPVEENLVLLHNAGGEVTGSVGVIRNITERRQAEKMLLNEQQLASDYINSLPGLFYVFDQQRFVRWNREWTRVTGYSDDEIARMYTTDFFEGNDKKLIEEQIHKTLDLGLGDAEAELTTKDGRRVPYYFSGARKTINGQDHLIGLGIDITERRQADEERENLLAQLTQSQKMESIGILAGGIAHDFNNILGGIIGYTELSQNDIPADNPVQGYLNEVIKAAERANALVKQILTFSRKNDQQLKPIKISPIIKESIKLLQSTLPKTIEIRQNIKTITDVVIADPTQIHQIMMNLGTNAFHAIQTDSGRIDIQLTSTTLKETDLKSQKGLKPGAYVKLTMQDNGCGIDAGYIDKIFDPFFTTKAVGKGTGMGLSVIHGIIANHGGFINVESRPGNGTTFDIFLPQVESEAKQAAEPSTQAMPGSGRIMFVDDEKPLINIAQRMLTSLGYSVDSFTNPLEALEVFEKNPAGFDLAITDLTMPKMTGLTLAQKLRAARADIPVILCSGFSDPVSQEDAENIGIQAIVAKPLVTAKFSETIHNILNSQER